MNRIQNAGRLLGALALMFSVGFVGAQEEGGKKKRKERPKRAPMAKVVGTVKSVDQETKAITITTEDQEDKSYTLTERVAITMRGPIFDGIQAGDKALLMVREGDEAPTVAKITISREGVSPAGKAKREKGEKKPRAKKRKKKGGADAPPPIE